MKPYVFIYGNQPFANKQKEDSILASYVKETNLTKSQIEIFDCDAMVYKTVSPETWLANLQTTCENLSFFAEEKVLLVRNLDKLPAPNADAKIEKKLAELKLDVQEKNGVVSLFLPDIIEDKKRTISVLSLLAQMQVKTTNNIAIQYKENQENLFIYKDAAQTKPPVSIQAYIESKLKKKIVVEETLQPNVAKNTAWGQQAINLLIEYMTTPPTNVYFIFSATIRKIEELPTALRKPIKDHTSIEKTLVTYQDFNPSTWVNQEAKSLGLQFDTQAQNLFISLVGTDLSFLHNELTKLALFCDNRAITTQDVLQISSPPLNNDIFQLTQHLVSRNLNASLSLLKQLLQINAKDSVIIHSLLASQFRRILHIKWLKEQSKTKQEITSFLKLPPFIANQVIAHASSFTTKELCRILCYLAAQDIPIKYDQKQAHTILADFILQVCTARFAA